MSVKHSKLLKLISFLLLLSAYLIFILFIDFDSLNKGYGITVALPIIYLFCFYLFLWEPVFEKKTPFLVMFSSVAFVRYVVLSILTIMNGTYKGISGVNPSPKSLTLAGILMCWELVTMSILIRYWSNRKIFKKTEKERKKLISYANPMIYLMFILITVVLITIVPQARQGLSFFGNINRSINDEIGSLITLAIRECFINAKYFFLFFIIIWLRRNNNYDFSRNRFFCYLLILLSCIVIIGLRIGTNRKKMLADSLAVMLILWNLFPKYKKITVTLISVVGVLLVAVTTVFRGMVDSTSMFFTDYINLDLLQPYFLGQYNVAIAIEANEFYGNMIDYKTYIIGFLRPLFGIGSIVKGINFTMVADLFDNRMSMGISGFRGDQIIPMIGEGYMLFGIVLSPIISIITARIGIFFDSLYAKSNRLEIVFISSIISFYLAQCMILNSTIILNMLSYRLVIYMSIVYLSYICKKSFY